MTNPAKVIETLAVDLKRHLDIIEEAEGARDSLKALIAEQIALLPPDGKGKPVKTYKVSWGQLQRTVTVQWLYRDAGVTQAEKDLAKAEAQVSHLKKVLKSRQEAAKAAKKASPVGESVGLRVVRGKG